MNYSCSGHQSYNNGGVSVSQSYSCSSSSYSFKIFSGFSTSKLERALKFTAIALLAIAVVALCSHVVITGATLFMAGLAAHCLYMGTLGAMNVLIGVGVGVLALSVLANFYSDL